MPARARSRATLPRTGRYRVCLGVRHDPHQATEVEEVLAADLGEPRATHAASRRVPDVLAADLGRGRPSHAYRSVGQ
jgi:hypothetical protein